MAKQGMKRPERTHTKPRNDAPPVPELNGNITLLVALSFWAAALLRCV